MEIEIKNIAYANNDIYQVGNVFSRSGTPILVAKDNHLGGTGYCFVDLENGKILTPITSLEMLSKQHGFSGDTLVKAKLIIDYKLDGDAENEDVE